MLDYSQIRDIVQEATREAEAEGRRPLSIRGFDRGYPEEFCRRIPFLGDYVPVGWVVADGIDDFFVDSSGFGGEGEAALSIPAFCRRLGEFKSSGDNYGFGIVEAGQFQIYIRVYRPDPRDITHTGLLTESDLRKIREA